VVGAQVPLLTVTEIVVLAVVLPEAPVMVTVDVPALAVLLAVSVRTLEVADEVGLNEAVTPLGNPLAANDTLPLNPFSGVTEMVSVALLPCATESVDAERDRVKLELVVLAFEVAKPSCQGIMP